MAILFADDKDMIKCTCGSLSFREVPVYTYKKIKDRIGEGFERNKVKVSLICDVCGQTHPEMGDIKNKRIVKLDYMD